MSPSDAAALATVCAAVVGIANIVEVEIEDLGAPPACDGRLVPFIADESSWRCVECDWSGWPVWRWTPPGGPQRAEPHGGSITTVACSPVRPQRIMTK